MSAKSSLMEELGPSLWQCMHYFAYWCPEALTDEKRYWLQMFYESLAHIIPCQICQSEYADLFYRQMPFDCGTAEKLKKWTVNVHNHVNRKLGKSELPPEVADWQYHKKLLNQLTTPTTQSNAIAHQNKKNSNNGFGWFSLGVAFALGILVTLLLFLFTKKSSQIKVSV